MTKQEVIAIYETAKAVYQKKVTLQRGKEYVNKKYNINVNSFADYYRAFQKMMDGGMHRRSINSDLRDYMLSKILEEFGIERYNKAIDTYYQSILWYESTHQTNMLKERSIYNKHKIKSKSHK